MRVLHLLSSNRYSGAENVVCQIVHMFKNDNQYEMLYCSPDGPIRESLEERDVRFVPMNAMSLFEIRRVICETKPDIVHAHDMKASFFASLVCGKIPLISHIHNNGFDSRKTTLKAVLYAYAAHKARHIFWVSQAAYNGYVFKEKFDKKSTVLLNIIDPNQIIEKAKVAECQDRYDVVFIGRMTYAKNPQRLIEVLSMVASKYPLMKAAIIGSGELEEEVKTLISERNLEQNIDFRGFMANPYGILRNAKVMAMTSRWEGMPMCALEATALGVPIVATPTDGLRELVVDDYNGFLTTENTDCVARIVDILVNEEMYYRLSANAKKEASRIIDIDSYKNMLLVQYEKW